MTFNSRRARAWALAAVVSLAGLVSGCTMPAWMPTLQDELTTAPPPPTVRTNEGEGLIAVADRMLASGDTAGALGLYQKSAVQPNADRQAMLRYARALFYTSSYELAAGAFASVLAEEPRNADALRGLGASLLARGKTEEARTHLEAAVRQSSDVRSIRVLAVLRVMEGETEEARMVYRKAMALWPKDLDLRVNYALHEALANNCTEAADVGQQVMTSPFARPQHIGAQALILALCGREAEAGTLAAQVMGAAGVRGVLEHAAQARRASNPVQRAAAVGIAPSTLLLPVSP